MIIHLQAIASHLPDTPMMAYGTGRWAHFNIKLHFFNEHELQQANTQLNQQIGNITIDGGTGGETINNVVNAAVNNALSEKDFLVRPPFDYNRTVAVTGVRWTPSENVTETAKKLVHEGLGLTDVKVVRSMRTPYNNRLNGPGLLKIEFENTEVKKRVLAESNKLRTWTLLGNKVVMRTSQTHEMRTQVGNWHTFLKGTNMEHMFNVSKNGTLLPQGEAVTNIQSNVQARIQGNQQFRPNSGIVSQGFVPSQSRVSAGFVPGFTPNVPPPTHQPVFNSQQNQPTYSNIVQGHVQQAQLANPLSQFMAPRNSVNNSTV